MKKVGNNEKKINIIKKLYDKINSYEFKKRNKLYENSFTRNRKLTFPKIIVMLARKSAKSVQNVLNEIQIYLSDLLDEELETITKGAYSQARANLNYTAFIELSNDIRDDFYKEYEYQEYKNFRLLAVDGSIITLPYNKSILSEFNPTNVVNQYKDKNKQIVQARVSVVYDVLNEVVVDSLLTNKSKHEITIVKEDHFKQFKKDDLVIFDRGYSSWELFALFEYVYNSNYLVRMRNNFYKEYTKDLFDKNTKINDIVVTLKATTKILKQFCIDNNLLQEIKVRFVKVVLPNGEVEVLATNVLNKDILKTEDFKELYFKRWKIETFYDIVKNRLNLENFTSLTPLGIKQDFYATMFLCNIEALITYDLNTQIEEKKEKNKKKKKRKFKQKINKSVSFNTIKQFAFELMFLPPNKTQKTLDKIYKLLETNMVAIRPNRHFKRPTREKSKISKAIKSANFQKRKKKIVF